MTNRTCESCGEVNSARARFCQACGRPLPPAVERREVRKTVSVVFIDVVGSASLGEQLDPEALRRVMTLYFERMSTVLTRHGARIEKFIGDAIVAIFGLPRAREDDALRAVRAAFDMRRALASLNEDIETTLGLRIQTRTGVNTGTVVAGDSAGGGALVTGDAVILAARLQQASSPGEVLLGESTLQLVRHAVRVEAAGAISPRGMSESAAFRLIDVSEHASRGPRRLDSPMVGRDYELSLLQQAYERAVDQRVCHLVTVLGPPGVGKSRLAAELASRLTPEANVIGGRCLPYGEGITFWPVYEIVRQAARIDAGDSSEGARTKITNLLAGNDSGIISSGVARLIGLEEGATSHDEAFWAVRRFLEILADQRPLMAMLDDVHWSEPELLDLVEHIAELSRGYPILLVVIARPEFLELRPDWAGGMFNATSLLLEPLKDRETDGLIQNLLGGADLAGPTRNRVVDATGGNPLFIEEMLSMLVDKGLLERTNNLWRPTAELERLEIPPSLRALLMARLEGLTPTERTALECGSVVGTDFYRGAIEFLMGDRVPPDLETRLGELVDRKLIRPMESRIEGDELYRFRHILLRDAAYESLPKDTRADLHVRCVDWLREVVGERVREFDDIIAFHLEQAHRFRAELEPEAQRVRLLGERAADALRIAGGRAFDRGDMRASVSLFNRARALLEHDERRHEFAPKLAVALFESGDMDAADRVLQETLEESNDDRLHARAIVERLELKLYREPLGTLEEAQAEATRLIPVFSELGDDAGLAKAWGLLGATAWNRARAAETVEALDRVIHHARRAGERWTELEGLTWLISAMLWGPTPSDEGLVRCAQISERAAHSPLVESMALRAGGVFEAMRGRVDEGRTMCRSGVEILRDLGLEMAAASSAEIVGVLETVAGNPRAAESALREGFEILDSVGDRGVLVNICGHLAHALCEQDRFDDAEEFTTIASEYSDPQDVVSQTLWRAAQARVFHSRDELDLADRLAEDASELATATDFSNLQAQTLNDIAAVAMSRGDADKARRRLEKARSLYEEKGNLMALRRQLERLERFNRPAASA